MFVEIGKFLLANKLVAIFALAYVVSVFKTVARFNTAYTFKLSLFKKLWELYDRYDTGWISLVTWFAMLVTVVIMAVVLSPGAPLFWLIMWRVSVREQKESELRHKASMEERDRRIAEKEAMNVKRAELRKEWLETNRPTIYYKVVDGVVAALRASDYEKARQRTEDQRIDGYWAHEKTLCLSMHTIVFLTKQGEETLKANGLGENVRRYKVAGAYSQLRSIAAAKGIELVVADDIFVPWVNETLVPFHEQVRIIEDCHGAANYVDLYDKLFPGHMQPVQVNAY